MTDSIVNSSSKRAETRKEDEGREKGAVLLAEETDRYIFFHLSVHIL